MADCSRGSVIPGRGPGLCRLVVVIMAIAVAMVPVVLLMGCISGPGSSGNQTKDNETQTNQTGASTDDNQTAEPPGDGTDGPGEPGPVALEPGMVVVYFMSHTSSGSSYHTVGGQTFEVTSSGGAVFCYLEGEDDLVALDDFYSPDYARNELHPYTVDGRLFLVQVWPDSSHAEFYEYDPQSGERSTGWLAYIDTNSDYSSWSAHAVLGDRLYYVTSREWDIFGGYTGGTLYVHGLDPEADKHFLLGYSDPNNFGSIHSAGGRLYRTRLESEDKLLKVTTIDPETGEIRREIRLGIPEYDAYESWKFCVDDRALYIAAVHEESETIMLWRLPWALVPIRRMDGSAETFSFHSDEGPGTDIPAYVSTDFWEDNLVLTHAFEDERDTLQGIDADQGYVVLDLFCWGETTQILYNTRDRTKTLLHPSLEGSYAQILVIR